MFRVVNDMTAGYTAFEAWGYDRFVAPAVLEMGRRSMDPYLVQVPKGGRLLDVGCGGGLHAVMMGDERPDLEIVGLDLNPGQVGRAVARSKRFHGRLSFVEGSALDLPFEDESFDTVTSFASIKHWPNPRRGVEEAVRVLKPGGLLMIVEADRGCHYEDAAAFVELTRGPSALKGLYCSRSSGPMSRVAPSMWMKRVASWTVYPSKTLTLNASPGRRLGS